MHLVRVNSDPLMDAQTSTKKSVCFADEDQVHQVERWSRTEKEAYWFTCADYEAFKKDRKECAKVFRAYKAGERTSFADFCLRGVEHLVDLQIRNEKLGRKYAAIDAVLEIQLEQQTIGVYDDEALRAAMLQWSVPCVIKAARLGEFDAKSAHAFYKPTKVIPVGPLRMRSGRLMMRSHAHRRAIFPLHS